VDEGPVDEYPLRAMVSHSTPAGNRAPAASSGTPNATGPASPRTVCHLIASNFFGGPERQIVEHCRRLDPSRWRGVIGSFRENRSRVEIIEEAESRGVETFLIDTRSQFSPLAILQIRQKLERYDASVLVTHGYKSNLLGYLAGRGSRVPQIPFVRGYTAEDWRIRVYENVDRWILRRFQRIFCVSEGTRDVLGAYGLNRERCAVVHNAIDPEPGGRASPCDLREVGVPDDARSLLAVGRLSPEKGHRFLVAAMQDPRLGGVHLVLLGDGKEGESLRKQAAELGVAPRVHFLGFQKDVLGHMAAVDLVVNPSLTEGLPNVVLEAFAVGVAVVATDVGGVAELVKPNRTGWLVPAGDPTALAQAIHEALTAPDQTRKLGEHGQALIREHFSFGGQAQRLMKLYDEAAEGKSRVS
jgi:glycosyltransferase involved in cell wall biosynthesis